ncbi:MAG: hypothetical protein CMB80_03800 [Flammeovirgaceae bacterium]|nr:hypothetical protein [Flammeovirgaceae bacterium]|tara:strand:+ start:5595 stop:6224 length:630 start_codon:yes stop_codon:yes gene_type:complete
MSHNKIKVGGQSPNSAGEISISLDNLSNVTATSASDGQGIIYDDTASPPKWIVNDLVATSTMVFIGSGSSQAYNTSGGGAISAGVVVEFYDSSPFNGISGASISTASNWVSGITLPVGNYIITANLGVTFTGSSGVATYRIHSAGGAIGTTGNVGYDDESVGSPAVSYLNVPSGTKTIDVRVIAVSSVNSLANQGTRQATHGFLEIRAV